MPTQTKYELKDTLLFILVSYGIVIANSILGVIGIWGGLNSLGMLYSIFVAPLVAIVSASRLNSKKNISTHHRQIWIAVLSYIPVTAILILLSIVLSN